jgi:hypothetical protein
MSVGIEFRGKVMMVVNVVQLVDSCDGANWSEDQYVVEEIIEPRAAEKTTMQTIMANDE